MIYNYNYNIKAKPKERNKYKMGQYYTVLTKGAEKGDEDCCEVHDTTVGDESYGQKLMEHSYVGNKLINAASASLFHHKRHVAWVGDYGRDDERCDLKLRNWLADEAYVRGKDKQWEEYTGDTSKWRFLVNHTKHVYLDMEQYIARCAGKDTWGNGEKIIVHPLPLLTSVGNGMGGGDYHAQYVNYDQTGIWAWDVISIEEEAPAGYCEYKVGFSEEPKKQEELANRIGINDAIKIGKNYYNKEFINNSWGEAYYYMLVQRDAGGDIPLAVDVGSNGRKNLEFMRDNEYAPEYKYAIVQIQASDYIEQGLALGYDLFDLLTDSARNMGIKNNK